MDREAAQGFANHYRRVGNDDVRRPRSGVG